MVVQRPAAAICPIFCAMASWRRSVAVPPAEFEEAFYRREAAENSLAALK